MLTQGESEVQDPSGSMVKDRRWKANVELAPKCPRCDSSHTKFCYYNNYSITQPRYFCKSCRRYWTKGGSLRNIPIGGSCRKNRRRKSAILSSHHVSITGHSPCGAVVPGFHRSEDPIGSTYGACNNSRVISTGATSTTDASTIDLALVYAKFLNQQSDSEPGNAMPELQRNFDNQPTGFLTDDRLAGCQGQFGPSSSKNHFSEGQQFHIGDLSLYHKQQDRNAQFDGSDSSSYELQPLPAEELPTPGMLWSHLPLVTPNFACQPVQIDGTEPVIDDSSTIHFKQYLNGNCNLFDFSGYETLYRY